MAARTLAFDVEKLRQTLLARVAPPPELLQKAFKNLDKQLDAKQKKYFANQGIVVSERLEENYEAQQRAQDQIFRISGVYAHERETRPATPGVILRVDPATGVVSLTIGSPSGEEAADGTIQALEAHSSEDRSLIHDRPQLVQASPPSEATPAIEYSDADVEPAQVIYSRGKRLPPEIVRILYPPERGARLQ